MTRLSNDRLSTFRLSGQAEPEDPPNDSVWRFNGTEAVRLVDETRTWQELELTFRVEGADLEGVFREMDRASGTYDVIEVTGGSYTVVERGADIVTLEPPASRADLRSTTEYVIDEYDETLQNRDEDIYEVTITAHATSPKSSGDYEETTAAGREWHFAFADGDLAVDRVDYEMERGGQTFDGSYSLSLVLTREEALVLEDSLNRQAAVRKQNVPDGQDRFRDENENERNTVTVTPPEAHQVVEKGDYAVSDWEANLVNDDFYTYRLELGITGDSSVGRDVREIANWRVRHTETWPLIVDGFTYRYTESWEVVMPEAWTSQHVDSWEGTMPTTFSQQHYESWPDDTGETAVHTFDNQDLSAYTTVTGQGHFWQPTDAVNGEPIGGGWQAPNKVARADADVIVDTWSEFETAVSNAGYGDIVWIDSDITMPTGPALNVPSGVTIAGDRGVDGSPGPLLEHPNTTSDSEIYGFFIDSNEGGDQRFTGFRYKGPNQIWSEDSDTHDATSEYGTYGMYVQDGNDGIRIDNMEIYGWGQGCAALNANNSLVEYSHIHRGTRDGQGYGIGGDDGQTIRYNTFAYCRHMASLEGDFDLVDNIAHPPHAGNVFDSHCCADDADVRRNTIIAGYHQDISGHQYGTPYWANGGYDPVRNAGYIHRHTPNTLVEAKNNWVFNDEPPKADSWFASIAQQHTTSFENMDVASNTIGYYNEPPGEDLAPDGRVLRQESQGALVCYDDYRGTQIHSTTGLNAYPSPGDTIRYWFAITDETLTWRSAFLFAVQDEGSLGDYYEVQKEEGDIRLQLDDSSTTGDKDLGSATVNWKPHVPYRIDVDWPADPSTAGITVTVTEHLTGIEVASFTADIDDTWTSGGIGFFSNSNPNVIYDDVVLV